MTARIGQALVHPAHGLGILEAFQEHHIAGRTTRFAVMNFGRMTVLVNDERMASMLRKPVTRGEADSILDYLGRPWVPEGGARNPSVDHRLHLAGLRSGDPFQVCDVVRQLAMRARTRKLTPRDAEVMQGARARLVAELAHVREETEAGVQTEIDERLARA